MHLSMGTCVFLCECVYASVWDVYHKIAVTILLQHVHSAAIMLNFYKCKSILGFLLYVFIFIFMVTFSQ